VNFLGSLGGETGVPGVGVATALASSLVNWAYGKHRDNRIGKVADLAGALADITSLAEGIAREVRLRQRILFSCDFDPFFTLSFSPNLTSSSTCQSLFIGTKSKSTSL
jgi:hypothetical protein